MAHMQGAIVFLGGEIDLLHWLAVKRSFWFWEIDLVEILLVAFAQLNIYNFCWLESSQGWNLFQSPVFHIWMNKILKLASAGNA